MNDLLENQEKLQEEAKLVLKELKIEELLGKYGPVKFAGSFETGLLVWRDIDMEVWVSEIDKKDVAEFVKGVINVTDKRLDFLVIDNRDLRTPHHPKGFYLGMRYCLNSTYSNWRESSDVWELDIWFVTKEESHTLGYTESVKEKLTEEKRRIILEIKNEIWKSPGYKKKIFSVDIYNGVLDAGVFDMESFREYLKTLGKEI